MTEAIAVACITGGLAMNQKLIDIYNTLLGIEVHGQSVLMLADCIRALRQVIDEEQNQMDPKHETVSEGNHE